jgi:hypothetical protein
MLIVSDSVIEARVRRAIARQGEILCRPRGERTRRDLGNYFTVDAHTGNPQRWHLELAELARECKVLQPGEVIED